ncbi:MAG TPA: hypothetical protein QGH10_10430 [Armatimonadota bacterium]|nr:hypothetical protein [Armatimonadota bacterium]
MARAGADTGEPILESASSSVKAALGVLGGVSALAYVLGIVVINSYIHHLGVRKFEGDLASPRYVAAGLPLLLLGLLVAAGAELLMGLSSRCCGWYIKPKRRALVAERQRHLVDSGVPIETIRWLNQHWNHLTDARWQRIRAECSAAMSRQLADRYLMEQHQVRWHEGQCRLALPVVALVALAALGLKCEDGGAPLWTCAAWTCTTVLGVTLFVDYMVRLYLPLYRLTRRSGWPPGRDERYAWPLLASLVVLPYGLYVAAMLYGQGIYGAQAAIPLVVSPVYDAHALLDAKARPILDAHSWNFSEARDQDDSLSLRCWVHYEGSDFYVLAPRSDGPKKDDGRTLALARELVLAVHPDRGE